MESDARPRPFSLVRSKWQDDDAGAGYALRRWSNPRAALRDPVLVADILDRYNVRPSLKPVLDAPCGTGRLRTVIERRGVRYVGLDVSRPMLMESAPAEQHSLVQGSIERLPFTNDSFDTIVCCRLLHHLHDEAELEAAIAELVRVAHRLVIASFWDSASLHAWRRRIGLRSSEGPRGRTAIHKRTLRRIFEHAGADVVGWHHSFRFVSQQAFVVANKCVPVSSADARHTRSRTELLALDLDGTQGSLGQA